MAGRTLAASLLALALLFPIGRAAAEEVEFSSPGFPPTKMDSAGGIAEDWGTLRFTLRGEGLAGEPRVNVQRIVLDGVVPAAQAQSDYGPAKLTVTAFRAPAWPSGFDVVTVRVEETSGKAAKLGLALSLPEAAAVGRQTISVGGRTVMSLLERPTVTRGTRDWGYDDEAQSLPNWGTPEVDCDPAFRNIRAGLGGVPICYRFKVERGANMQIVLGLLESHHTASGQRVQVCKVEGAPAVEVDPLAKWGRHRPGALLFKAADENRDGWLEINILPAAGSPDQNPILNVIWLFSGDISVDPQQVVLGRLNQLALRYVDVGGPTDQGLYPAGKLEFDIELSANGSKEMTFYAACPGGSVPVPGRTAWTPEALLKAAKDVHSSLRR